jgi:hypothetical protein
MDSSQVRIRELAHKLLAHEVENNAKENRHVNELLRVHERLRLLLSNLIGADGFAALMRRSLALASADAPELRTVHFGTDGTSVGLDKVSAETSDGGAHAALTLTTHLLTLLATFIGETLMFRLLNESWPGESPNEPTSVSEDS